MVFWLLAAAALAQDPSNGAWTPFAQLQDARADACAVRLSAGRVLVTGGTGASGPRGLARVSCLDASRESLWLRSRPSNATGSRAYNLGQQLKSVKRRATV